MPLIQPSYSLPNFLHTLFFSKVIITTALFLTSVNLQTILLQTHAYGACDCGQGNHPARQSALGSPASRLSPPSCRRRFVHINAIKVLPARGVDCAARSPVRRARSTAARTPRTLRPACRAARATQIAFTPSEFVPAGWQVIRPQRPSICALQHPVRRLPPKQPTSAA